MIVVDSSALIAITLGEPEEKAFTQCIETAGHSVVSAPTYLETSNVLEGRHGAAGRMQFEAAMRRFAGPGLSVVSFDEAMADLAREGFRRYGKGRHPAALNFGDCFAYALAKALDAPLLFKGTDFGKTDVTLL
jgi:ribonuclease VapC